MVQNRGPHWEERRMRGLAGVLRGEARHLMPVCRSALFRFRSTLRWHLLAVVGLQVTIKNYRIIYRENIRMMEADGRVRCSG